MGQVTEETIKMIKANHERGTPYQLTTNELDQIIHAWREHQKSFVTTGLLGMRNCFIAEVDKFFEVLKADGGPKMVVAGISKILKITDLLPEYVKAGLLAKITISLVDERTAQPPSYNEAIYRDTIIELIPDIEMDDLKWLCNKAASLYQKCDKWGGCVDNFRVARNIQGSDSLARYETTRNHGCCGFADEEITNPLTNNRFIIGFNYGH